MIFLKSNNFDEYLEKEGASFLREGSDAKCYKLGQRVVRRLKCPENFTWEKRKKYLQFKELVNKNFLFTDELIYQSFKIAGMFMPLAPGVRLLELPLDTIDIMLLIEALERLIQGIDALSEERVNVGRDIAPRNTIFDGTDFYFVDTSEYIQNNDSVSDSWKFNMKKVMYMLYKEMFPDYSLYRFVQQLYGFGTLYNSDLLLQSPREFLSNIKKELEEYLETRINSFNEGAYLLSSRGL